MGLILNGDKYEWIEDEPLQPVNILLEVMPSLEERITAVESGIVELAEVVVNG